VDAPTTADIIEWSQVEFDDLGFEEDTEKFDRLTQGAVLWVQRTTGRTFQGLDEETEDPDEQWLNWAMGRAVQMSVEYQAYASQPDIAETAADFNQIASFSVGSYSETRRSPNARSRSIHPWSDLSDLLLDLMTDEKASEYSDGPAISAPPLDWDVGKDIIDANKRQGTVFGPYRSPWDNI
jgi:hypothetical protein